MPMFRIRTGTQCIEVEDKDRMTVLERVINCNGISVEEVSSKESAKQYQLFPTREKGAKYAGNRTKEGSTKGKVRR